MSRQESKLPQRGQVSLATPLQQVDRTFVRFGGRRLIYFGGCDYLRLASHPVVLRALATGLRRYGLNVAASRLTTGHHALYDRLEQRLARFFGVESAVLASSGYSTSLMVAQALAGEFSPALIDARAHASLWDAAKLLGGPVIPFKHRDAADLARAVRRCGARAKPVVLTDGLFAHDGGLAPLLQYLAVVPASAVVVVDDAHGAGIIGPKGRGTADALGVSGRRLVQTITLSKAFGVYGGAILGTEELRQAILARSRLFAGNTPLPLPLAYAALRALELVAQDKSLRQRLRRNTDYVKSALRHAGRPVPDTPSPIVSFVPKSPTEVQRLRRRLLEQHIYPAFIRYPGGPPEGYFRFAISSEHSVPQLDALVAALAGG